MKKLLLMTVLFSLKTHAQVSVGWETSCDYDVNSDATALQQAIDDGHVDIRLTNENEYLHSISIRNQARIKGGYSNCADAENGIQTSINSVINAALDDDYSGMFIFDIEKADILFDSL